MLLKTRAGSAARAASRALCAAVRASSSSSASAASTPRGTYKVPASALKSFREKGWAVLPKFLSAAELAPVSDVYDRFMTGEIYESQSVVPSLPNYKRAGGVDPKKDYCDMSQPFGTPFDQWGIVNAMLPRIYYPPLVGSLYEQRAADAAAQLFPGEPMAIDYDQLLNKRPQKKKAVFAWHQDVRLPRRRRSARRHTYTRRPPTRPTLPPPSRRSPQMAYWPQTAKTTTVTFSLAVDATTVENGALRFLNGSGLPRQLHEHKPVGKNREDSHAIAVEVDESSKDLEMACVERGDVTIHDEWVVHGSGGNLSAGTRRTYVIAFRAAETVKIERAAGFTHSHNDSVNWDSFNKWA